MRKLLVPIIAVALVAAAGGHAAARPQKSIKVGDDFFVRKGAPPTVTVSRGTRVVFDWRGKSLHNVHARKGPITFRSNYKTHGSFAKILSKRGTYVVYCDIHGPSMRMTIKVR
jgi:plastocyanin